MKMKIMKRIYTLMTAASVMLVMILILSGCTKSVTTPGDEQPIPNTFLVYSADSTNIGSITISKEPNGDARVSLAINNSLLKGNAPYQPILESSTLPTANLEPLNAEGKSETYPVRSSNKGLIVSYDALMYMRDLKLIIIDANGALVVESDIH
jgi:hypothetical protein